ncbi:MAG: hypothetical protein ACK5R9_09940 [bacterium]
METGKCRDCAWLVDLWMMPELGGRISVLGWLGGDRRLLALSAALRASEVGEQGGIADELLAQLGKMGVGGGRGVSGAAWEACLALAGAWDGLRVEQREGVYALFRGRVREVAGKLSRDGDARVRASLLALVGGLQLTEAAEEVVGLLSDADAGVGERAEWALGELVKAAGVPGVRGAERVKILGAIERAIEQFDRHRRTGVLRTAIKLAPWTGDGASAGGGVGGGGLLLGMGWMNDQQHPAQLVMRGLIRRGAEPQLRSCAWSWLKFDALSPACLERLAQPASAGQHSAVLERWQLVLNPARARALGKLRGAGGQSVPSTLPTRAETTEMRGEARAGLVRMIGALPGDAQVKDGAWAGRLIDAEASVRLMLVRTAVEQRRCPGALLDLVFDPDARIATLAADAVLAVQAYKLGTSGWEKRLPELALRSPHERVRALGRQLRCRSIGAGAGGGVGGGTRRRLADLAKIVERFKQKSADAVLARQAASAATAMGLLPGPEALALLRSCLGLPDMRVRANALDAILRHGRRMPLPVGVVGQTSSLELYIEPSATPASPAPTARDSIIEVLLDHALDPHHRIRGSAARGLMTMGMLGKVPTLSAAGQRTLGAMLTDTRAMHRVAGLWLVERFAPALPAPAEIIDMVSGIEQRAGEGLERLRAGRASARLHVEVRSNWSKRAPTIGGSGKDQVSASVGAGQELML